MNAKQAIKPLPWVQVGAAPIYARCAGHTYTVRSLDGRRWLLTFGTGDAEETIGIFATVKAAKQGGQDHFERLIGEALP